MATKIEGSQKWELWVCCDCHEAHHTGEAVDVEPRPWSKWNSHASDNTTCMECWKSNEECDHNAIGFASGDCDGCGSGLAGARYKYEGL